MVFLPALVEKLLRCKIHPMVYGFGELYTVGPMIGVCYHLYYTTTWWDKLLHIRRNPFCSGWLVSDSVFKPE